MRTIALTLLAAALLSLAGCNKPIREARAVSPAAIVSDIAAAC